MTHIEPVQAQVPAPNKSDKWLAAGGIAGAILASTCCIVPLLLVLAGVGGAWIGSLTALEPFKPYFIAVTLGFIGFGFWHVYFKAKPPCEDGSYCAKPQSTLITQVALWAGLVIVLLAATIDWWASIFY
ncbi:mercuric transporter MerT family protein [uncultured Maricaulis sp.]|uniref:mercuric transporter MerT family protein n=1 Tax=uncultured Maricaulis sp. TaxID=174710 RepID=UPI0030DB9D76